MTETENSKCEHLEKQGEPLQGTDHTGTVYFRNDWGEDLYSITIRHRRSNDPTKQEEKTFYGVGAGKTVGPLTITYTTGAGSPFDYWWVKFRTNVSKKYYTIKDNFYCYISSSDDGKVNIRADSSTKKLYVDFSSSSGCTVSILDASGTEAEEPPA